MNISISIVEDDAGIRSIITGWIAHERDFTLVSQFSNVESALAHLPGDRPNVVLVDINLSGQSGITCVRQLKAEMPETQFLIVTVFEDGDHIFDALTAGASGYLLKRTPRDELIAAIRQVHAGGSPMTSYIARKVVGWFQKKEPRSHSTAEMLSARESEILRLLARGFAYKEMADALGVSMGTINTHVRRIYQKLHVSSRGEAVALLAPIPGNPHAPDRPEG